MTPIEYNNPAALGPEHCNHITETQDKGLKIVFVNMIEVCTDEMNIYFQ